MGNIEISKVISAPVGEVFGYIDDYKNTTRYMEGLTEWKPTTKIVHGKGAYFRVAMKAGPKSLGSTVEIIEWTKNKAIAWESMEGFEQTGRWSFAKHKDGTEVTFEMSFSFGGGMAGKMLAKVSEPIVHMNLSKSLENLAEEVEGAAAVPGRR